MNIDNKVFHCFSCGAKGTIVNLVADIQGVPVAVAIRWLREGFNAEFVNPDHSLLDEVNQVFNKEVKEKKKLFQIPEDIGDQFYVDWAKVDESIKSGECPAPLRFPIEKYGLNCKTLEAAGIGFDVRTSRIAIPYRTPSSKLVGFKGRSTDGTFPKYMAIGDMPDNKPYYGFRVNPLPNHIYGIDKFTEAGISTHYKESPVIIVEGEFDALKLHQIGYTNTVALGTSKMTLNQKQQILNSAEKVILYLDPDEAGYEGTRKIGSELVQYIGVQIVEGHENDPADAELSEIESALYNTKSILAI